MRRASWILGSVSVLLVATGAVSKFAVYPELHQMPDDAKGTMHFQGTLTALDPAAVQKGDLAHAVTRDLPVTADRTVKAVKTSGSTIVLNDHTDLYGQQRALVSISEHQYAVDRRDLMEKATPKGVNAEPHRGLSAGFPLSPKAHDYPFWDAETQTTGTAAYTGTTHRQGREVYVFRITAAGPLQDPTMKGALPPAMPKTALAALNPQAPLGSQPDVVPLAYTSLTDMTAYIDSETGVTIALDSHKSVTAVLPGEPKVELFPVADAKLSTTKASEKDLADTASTGALVFWLLSDAGPYAVWALALALLLLAYWLERRHRRAAVTDTDPLDDGQVPGQRSDTAESAPHEQR
ncbi:porin PorA family protein [Yinghuangia seranimata]|uniref:porin PorA family protein n=1 Tax=Yinghuangia seranimata TaxID=408067 RepID=UPI00248B6F6B|nr:porin PorA family protein [Yinghuangia seranimata]MDI2129613.1 porin PorA family protein [Yinghuangia seranimata]